MANRRARAEQEWGDGAGAGSNSLDRATFLDYVNEYEKVERDVAAAKETVSSTVARRKGLRKTILAAGIGLAAFDRALADASRSGEEREAEHAEYLRNLAWMGKPAGYQPSFDLEEMSEADLNRVDSAGFDAGKRGDRADSNSWTPGREEHQRWHSAWMRGQAEKVATEIKAPDAPKRGRGRPRKTNGEAAAPPPNGAAAPPHLVARELGKEDALAGNRDHAARYPAGEYDGHAEGEQERHAAPEQATERQSPSQPGAR